MPTTEPTDNAGANNSRVLNAIAVDVEEHFQVSAFEGVVDRDRWAGMASRVVANTDRLLELFDDTGVQATFFILGWVAERHGGLVRRIAESGHEIGSHGYSHRLIYNQTPSEFRSETELSRKILEDASGMAVEGYRAASFSIVPENVWALDILAENGFQYDSSLFPVIHDRYGFRGIPRHPFRLRTPSGATLAEVPPSTLPIGGMTLPVAGGGYLRFYPYAMTRWAVDRLNRKENIPANVYIHPWEVDPEQPRIRSAPLRSRFRHYVNLGTTQEKVRKLLETFRFGPLSRVLEEYGDLEEMAVGSS
ncbi:MAG: DUF3473 domain-containing protein [Acidobacteria bacterium]|uniref:DUF3473 domain-containing protein n=1 Tax=Candidatus Polarisedimenticola svalbardensis TaxID=2886004 RepID=A0A8J7CDI7_9BACT|nr:DUF3473 domain-containing protein [Candidatus Polarisedimenticola svalbardensis]